MNALSPNHPKPKTKKEFSEWFEKLTTHNLTIISGSSYENLFYESIFHSTAEILGNEDEADWEYIAHLFTDPFIRAIKEQYKNYIDSRGQTPTRPIFSKIFNWELKLEMAGPLLSLSEMEQMLESCPSIAAPSYYKLFYAHYDQLKEAA